MPTRWRASASGGGFSSALRFEGNRTEIDERTLLATLGYQFGARVSLEFGAGAILDGSLAPEGGAATIDVGVGPAATVSISWLALLETSRRPFIFLAAALSASTAPAGDARITAFDARGALLVGKTFFNRFTIYASARVFGGPVFWSLDGDPVVGSDVHHYSLGGGARLVLPKGFDLFVEGMALGEQSLSAGAGWSF